MSDVRCSLPPRRPGNGGGTGTAADGRVPAVVHCCNAVGDGEYVSDSRSRGQQNVRLAKRQRRSIWLMLAACASHPATSTVPRPKLVSSCRREIQVTRRPTSLLAKTQPSATGS